MAEDDPKRFAARRAKMIDEQLRRRGIHDPRVLSVMGELPREAFMPSEQRRAAYRDGAQPIGRGQTISQPYVVALMTRALDVQPAHRVLEIGTGSGYQTAILARLAHHVYSIERIDELSQAAGDVLRSLDIENVTLRVADGTLGWPEQGPFDRILCGAGSPDVPASWVDQLAEDGCIVLPAGPRDHQQLFKVSVCRGKLERTHLCDVRFVPLIGAQGWQGNS